jgi:outer membrane protein assembly factor BamB
LTESGLNVLDVRTGGSVDFLDLPASASLGPVWCDLLFFSTERVGDPCGAYDLAGRRLLWKRDLMQEIHSAFGITEQYPGAGLVLGSGGRYVATRGLHTFGGSMEDGHLLWCSPEDSLHAWPNVDGGRIYMLSSQAKDPLVTHFVALEEATGATVYDISLADHSPPLPMKLGRALRGVLLDEHIAFSSDSGVLVVFRLSDGMPVWHYRHDESLWGGTTDGRRLYVSANDGNILVFEGQEA